MAEGRGCWNRPDAVRGVVVHFDGGSAGLFDAVRKSLLWMIVAACSRVTAFLSYDGGRGREKSKTNKPGGLKGLAFNWPPSCWNK